MKRSKGKERRRHGEPAVSRKYHDRVANVYDAAYDGKRYWEFHDRLVWEFLKKYLPMDRPARAIDLGCGTGKWGVRLARSGFSITFIDNSPKMIDQARRKYDESGAGGAEFLVADIGDLSLVPVGAFDLALAFGDPLSLCASAETALKEIRRCLKPGAALVASVDHRLGALTPLWRDGDLPALGEFLRTGWTHWFTTDEQERFPVRMFLADELTALLERSGFAVADLVGLTVFPARAHEGLIAAPEGFARLLELEQQWHRRRELWGNASHLLVAARRQA